MAAEQAVDCCSCCNNSMAWLVAWIFHIVMISLELIARTIVNYLLRTACEQAQQQLILILHAIMIIRTHNDYYSISYNFFTKYIKGE
jgi:hypothetical protein